MSNTGASLGGQATAKKLIEESRKRYYESPNYCKECGETIHIKEGQRVADVKKKVFCNKSCSAKFNNRQPGRKRQQKSIVMRECSGCGKEFEVPRLKSGALSKAKICPYCKNNISGLTKKNSCLIRGKTGSQPEALSGLMHQRFTLRIHLNLNVKRAVTIQQLKLHISKLLVSFQMTH